MNIRTAAYNALGTIDVEIEHPQLGWIPFSASPDDPEEFGREMYATLAAGNVASAPPPAPAPRAMVLKSVVQARIIEAGKMQDAYAALTQNPIYFARWFAPDRPEVYCDDPDAILLVTALGLDPDAILAPA